MRPFDINSLRGGRSIASRALAARLWGIPAIVAACAVGVGAVTPSAALAVVPTTVTCGQVITTSIKLANDLQNCPGIGLEVGAGGITIDLNGHTIDGTGPRAAGGLLRPDHIGIENGNLYGLSDGHSGVTIDNGTVTDFGEGIWIAPGANGNVVRRMLATGNDIGILGTEVDGLLISDSTATYNLFSGFGLNYPYHQGGSFTNARLERSTALYNSTGIDLRGTYTNVVISRNTASNNRSDGLFQAGIPNSVLIDNNDANQNGPRGAPVGEDGDGIDINSQDQSVVLSRNRTHDNTQSGIEASAPTTDGGQNRSSGNGLFQCPSHFVCKP